MTEEYKLFLSDVETDLWDDGLFTEEDTWLILEGIDNGSYDGFDEDNFIDRREE
jgi:hypothetical protein